MQNFTRRLMSGASFALLAVGGLPSAARAASTLSPIAVSSEANFAAGLILLDADDAVSGDPFSSEPHLPILLNTTSAIHTCCGPRNQSSITSHVVGHVFADHSQWIHAKTEGVSQNASDTIGDLDAQNMFTVETKGAVEAFAGATHAEGLHARAVGIGQLANGSTATNDVSNDGFIGASAYGNHARYAHATATGVAQTGIAGGVHNTVDNHGSIEAIARASSAEFAHANAVGVAQKADPTTATNYISNTGFIGAFASARNAQDVHAEASGVDQHIAVADYAANSVTNDGAIVAEAVAWSAESANANAVGIQQHDYSVDTGQNNVFNSGLVLADAFAHDAEYANATAVGVSQHDYAIDFVDNKVENFDSGDIVAIAAASNAEYAFAEAEGVEQRVHEADNAFNTVTNYGVIVAAAHANFGEHATATARGIRQSATADFVAFSFYGNEVFNFGFVGAFAKASSATKGADAHATGVAQYFDADVFGGNLLVNNSYAGIAAVASASDAKYVHAHARGVSQSGTAGTGFATNSVSNNGVILAGAFAHGDAFLGNTAEYADARATGVYQHARADSENATNNVINHSSGQILALATASFASHAYAHARGINQDAHAPETAFNYVGNSGLVEAVAFAHGSSFTSRTTAKAFATGVRQRAHADFSASNSVQNNGGAIAAYATAASATYQSAVAIGVSQNAGARYTAKNNVSNEGLISAAAFAIAGGLVDADATGVYQDAGAEYTAANYIDNHGDIVAKATAVLADDASARAFGMEQYAQARYTATNSATNQVDANIHAYAYASAYDAGASAVGAGQSAHGDFAHNRFVNFSEITATAYAAGGGNAEATGRGVWQSAFGPGHTSLVGVENAISNTFEIHAKATAVAGDTEVAKATAQAFGVEQNVLMSGTGLGENYLQNSGTISAHASARAIDATSANAKATAVGAYQAFDAADGTIEGVVHNSGLIKGVAYASTGFDETGSAVARAGGVIMSGTAKHLALDVVNTGTVDAYAWGEGYTVHASAAAIGVLDKGSHAAVSGTISNQHLVEADAFAFAESGSARAIGIGVAAEQFVGKIVNEGTIEAFAFGPNARATAIGVTSNGHAAHTGIGHVTNEGGFIDASADYAPGWAIQVANAPNEVDINLEDAPGQTGEIHGNIGIAADDTITVKDGTTFFDGTVNPAGGAPPNANNVGTLNVNADGTLWLANRGSSYWSNNAVVNVNQYNQPGTLELDIDAAGDNGVVNANGVNLDNGNVVVNPQPGLYPNSLTYHVVFGPHGATLWNPTVDSTFPSPLLTFATSYPNSSEADITLTRVAFDLVPGLTPNEEAVGDGLENAYSTSLSGEAKLFYESLFRLSPGQYPPSLDMLSGEEYGEMAMLDAGAARTFMNTVTDRLDAEAALGGGSMAANLRPYMVASANGAVAGPSQGLDSKFWAQGYGSWTNTKSTISGPGFTTSNGGIAAGWDTHVDNNLILGIGGSYTLSSPVHFEPFGSPVGARGSYTGFEIGGYGRYDDSDSGFYLTGTVDYGNYRNKLVRYVTLPNPFPPPSSLSGFLGGKFTNSVWSVQGEGGYPLDAGGGLIITPYVAVAYIGSDSGAFTESGSIGPGGHTFANLHVSDASATSISTYLGAQLATSWSLSADTTLLPSIKVAWAHEFDNSIWDVNAFFTGLGTASAFTVNGAALAKDSAMVDASISAALQDNLDATLSYQGRYNDTGISNAVIGRLDLTLP